MKSSGLLQTIAEGIQELTEGLDLFQVMVVFCLMVLICTTFISHTVRLQRGEYAIHPTSCMFMHIYIPIPSLSLP